MMRSSLYYSFVSFITVTTALVLTSCSISSKREIDQLNAGAQIKGIVVNQSGQAGQSYLLLYRWSEGTAEHFLTQPVTGDGSYHAQLLPGEYLISSFIDTNGNGIYETVEPATYLGAISHVPTIIELGINELSSIKPLVIEGSIPQVEEVNVTHHLNPAIENIGRIASLDEPMFSKEAVENSLWHPLKYINTYGGGLMMLQPYDKLKTPVLFIHGILGSATNFEDIMQRLDTDRYQPWILQYPSGASLNLISDYIVNALNQLQATHNFETISIVAHSMGGLVTRSYIKKYSANPGNYAINSVLTINSPLYGMRGAEIGLKFSPIAIPSWRNVATNSDFIVDLHAWRWPESIPYVLFFSYLPGENGDGVVPLNSQLSRSLQEEAQWIRGFEGQHTEILYNEYLGIQALNVIDRYATP